jgi:cytochrome bd-type quinol oxidase subunit 2
MITLWYGILAFMLTTYIVLDGRNFGAGHRFAEPAISNTLGTKQAPW